MQPRQALFREYVPSRLKLRSLIDRANVKVNFRGQRVTFARQGGPASCAEAPPPAG